MPTALTVAQHLEGLRSATVAFVRYAERAGPRAAVPTCPDWTVRDLVAHQGMVHRWAAATLRGDRVDTEALEAAGRAVDDQLEWLRSGAIEVAQAVSAAAEDTEAPVFLNDAPPPRGFWARRQCHETTIHAVDALAAALGRPPRGDETWIDAALAADGIDELLGGFLTRPRARLRAAEETTLVVAPDASDDWWEVRIGPQPAVATRGSGRAVSGDRVLSGSAVELYLALWNRSDRSAVRDPGGVLTTWRETSAVTWS